MRSGSWARSYDLRSSQPTTAPTIHPTVDTKTLHVPKYLIHILGSMELEYIKVMQPFFVSAVYPGSPGCHCCPGAADLLLQTGALNDGFRRFTVRFRVVSGESGNIAPI